MGKEDFAIYSVRFILKENDLFIFDVIKYYLKNNDLLNHMWNSFEGRKKKKEIKMTGAR